MKETIRVRTNVEWAKPLFERAVLKSSKPRAMHNFACFDSFDFDSWKMSVDRVAWTHEWATNVRLFVKIENVIATSLGTRGNNF